MDSIENKLFEAFPNLREPVLTKDFIFSNQDLMWDDVNVSLYEAVPLYMLNCIYMAHDEGELIFENTLKALNEYGRASDPNNDGLNFKFKCNAQQKLATIEFLNWCKSNLQLDYEPHLSRALNNWKR